MDTISMVFTHREVIANKKLVKAIFVTSFIMMTALGAYVRIPLPFSPVPITLQTFFVILCGAILGRKLGTLAQASYVGLGVLGMPIFQSYGMGIMHLAGPTGGYLAGFIAAAFIVGNLLGKRASGSFLYSLLAMSAGLLAIYACGISWLMIGYKMDFIKAISLGCIPFIPGAALKLVTAAWIYSKLKPRIDEIL